MEKLLARTRPDKMADTDISAIREALGQLKASSANACQIAGLNWEGI